MMRSLAVGALWLVAALAQAQVTSVPNLCDDAGGLGSSCFTDDDCAFRPYATRCVEHVQGDPASRRCEAPCEADEAHPGTPDHAACALGETCLASLGDGTFYCAPTRFRMDLNLVDQCVAHFLAGTGPTLGSNNACSLEANLNQMLDQDGDGEFDIFDVDGCVQAFLHEPACNPDTGTCPTVDMVYCNADEDCGAGLFCDEERHFCTRECGVVASREPGLGALERACAGRLKTCDHAQGRCVDANLEQYRCSVDRECPVGAYCLVGRCAARCSRALDCPDSGWYCAPNNTCRVLPSPEENAGNSFDPRNYAVLFGTNQATLTPLENHTEVPLLIMDLTTKREVLDNPSVGFGYRLEVTYAFKQDPRCFRSPDEWTLEDREECLIEPAEEFVQLASPFGTVFAVGRPKVAFTLNPAAAERLSPGKYVATVNAIFDNGNQDTVQVRFNKTTASGEYVGSLSVVLGAPENQLNAGTLLDLAIKMDIKEDQLVRWNELLAAENLAATSQDYTDITQGQLIHAHLHGNDAVAFALPGAESPADNEIPLKGIYSPQLGIMRLVGVVEIPADFCLGEEGACADASGLQVRNLFGRTIRRILFFNGTYDDVGRRFLGNYRERVSGLSPGGELTLEGGFVLSQTSADETGLQLSAPLLPSGASLVDFPHLPEVLAGIDADVATWCQGSEAAAAVGRFTSASSYLAYLGSEDFPIFPDVVEFKQLIQDGIDNLQDDDSRAQDVLTLHEYLAGRIVLCGEEEAAAGAPLSSSAPACVDEARLRCALSLYRRAVVGGLAGTRYLGNPGANPYPLFCSSTLPAEGCHPSPTELPFVATLLEHNRFHQELAQATKFQADQDLSDAFFALYRNRLNPFTQGAALNFKADKLERANRRYDDLTALVLEPAAASVLFDWRMWAFEARGQEWLRQMHVMAADRMDALAELVDLRRRIYARDGERQQLLGEHLAQMEYLQQVYLMALQREWQGEDFKYGGEAGLILERLKVILKQLHQTRNALGVVPEQVFFENSDPSLVNWRSYLRILAGDDGTGGLLAEAQSQIDSAVANLQASLADVDALEDRIFELNNEYEGALIELCGDEEASAPCNALWQKVAAWEQNGTSRADILSQMEAFIQNRCGSSDPLAVLLGAAPASASSEECEWVKSEFVSEYNAQGPACPLSAAKHNIMVRGERRACIGGAMGGLLLEKEGLLREREGIRRDMMTLLKRLEEFAETRDYVEGIHIGQRLSLILVRIIELVLTFVDKANKTASEVADEVAESANCMLIAGLAAGTDCPQSFASGASKVSVTVARTVGERVVETLKEQAVNLFEIANMEFDFAIEDREAQREMTEMSYESYALVTAYIANIQASLAVEAGMAETRFLAKDAAAGLNDSLSLLLDHLVGRESGSVLVGNFLVRESSATFRRALQVAYRMVLAFAHRYNLSVAERNQLIAQVMQAVTVEDLQALVQLLIERERGYCGREAIDCDAFNNLNVLRLSLRDLLFPQLRDLVDPATGRVVTRGEQFHNIITSPPFLRRRVRGAWAVDQVELPFTVLLQQRDPGDTRGWLLNPTQCNHILDGDPTAGALEAGTVAVNVVGQRLGPAERAITYELGRGHVDQIRACHAESVQTQIGSLPELDYPIRTQVVGYSSESAQGQQTQPPTYFVRSGELNACLNQAESAGRLDGGSCWHFFGRDRSLASPDYTLYIPLAIDGENTSNSWITGAGLPESQRPVIEDVVLYLRYRTRPISEP
ncbi:MAG: dickkopf-related protein [Myxococcota bacterium]